MTNPEYESKQAAQRIRRPSLPLGAYRVLHKLGFDNLDSDQFRAFEALYHDIEAGRVDTRPSVLEEAVVRVRHTVGTSGLSDEQFRRFIQDCRDEGLL